MDNLLEQLKNFNPYRRIRRLAGVLENTREQIDILRSRMDVGDELFDKFQEDRISDAYKSAYRKEFPLVSVCVGTYNRGQLLVNRCLKSILSQDYENIEVIVVGDCCTDNTEQLVGEIKDKRLHFVNLPERGKYPENPRFRWMVAGTTTFNYALNLAKGDFITHLDDDDEYMTDRIKRLIEFIKQTQSDIVWHPFCCENDRGKWKVNKTMEFKAGQITTSSVLYHNWFKQIPWDMNAYRYLEPGDWNRFRKIKFLGASALRCDEPLLKHYREMQQIEK